MATANRRSFFEVSTDHESRVKMDWDGSCVFLILQW
jgi:hypothetical protein